MGVRLALFTKYSRLAASSRLRTLQYLPAFRSAGIEAEPYSLFDDAYVNLLYKNDRRSSGRLLKMYASRLRDLFTAERADLLWLEYEALPYLPYWFERVCLPRGVPYVVDYDDAVFHNYDLATNTWLRKLLGSKIDKVMASAAAVICGNDYLAMRAIRAGARRVEIIPTVVDAERYGSFTRAAGQPLVIGWIGSPSTQQYLLNLKPVFQQLNDQYDIQLTLVGVQSWLSTAFGAVPVRVLPWSEASEVEMVADFDIGIMPLVDGPWERGKCGYKLIQYMACGKPVVASPVGVNPKIVKGSACGLVADSSSEWLRSLSQLINEPELRARFGANGRRAVETEYSLQVQAPRLISILRSAAQLS